MPEPAAKKIGRMETSISSNSRATVSDMVVRPVDANEVIKETPAQIIFAQNQDVVCD